MAQILILEDDPVDLELIETALQNEGVECNIVRVSHRQAFLDKLNQLTPDLILADYVLPKFNGSLALDLRNEICPDVPFILISGVLGEEQAIDALKRGATDYVLKQRLGRLVPSVKRALRESEERKNRQKVVKTLRETDDLLRAIVDASPVGIITLTREQRVITWNAAAETLYGYRANTVIDGLLPLNPDFQKASFDANFDQVLAGQTVLNREFKHSKQDGGLIDVSLSLAPLHNSDGEIYGVVMTATDITTRKQIEAERLNLLQQETVAREAAENANRIKDEFLAVLSHELRTPLNAIMGWIQLIQKGSLKPDIYRRALDTIERNAAAQTRLIQDLLDLSRIVRGQVNLVIQPVDVVSLIHATVDTQRPAAEAKSIKLILDISTDLPAVLADANRLQQIFWNLLSNAIKFTPKEGRIMVRVKCIDAHLQIQVEDSGIGIAPEFLPHVFEHFRQADGTSQRSQGGLGLGLAITRRLVELHGGTIGADSPGLDQGATFTVSLPIRLPAEVGQSPRPSADDELSLDGVTVLVVDDEADSQELLTIILEHCGAQVESVSSAKAAYSCLDRHYPDVIISDIGMPEEDGYSFLQTLNASSDRRLGQIPAIAITAYAMEEDRQRALRAGFVDHIPKPFDTEAVVKIVHQIVNAQSK